MHLIQIFLPLTDNAGHAQPASIYRTTQEELATRFGGLTVYSRSPAKGVWEDDDSRRSVDDMLVVEVMVEDLDKAWWDQHRKILELRFRQESVLIRAIPIEIL